MSIHMIGKPVSVAAANSNKLPAPSLYPGSSETYLVFFLAVLTRSNPVALTDAGGVTEAFLNGA
jgi:hypothetical protein